MGLDIYHCKATLGKSIKLVPGSENYITEGTFEGFDVDFKYFENYVQLIDTPKELKTLIFVKKESELDEIKTLLKYDYEFFFENDCSDIDKAVSDFQQKHHLTNCYLHRWEAPKWFGFRVFEYEKQIGFYYEEFGYQRKGMNSQFWERFNSDSIYCFSQKTDFENALSCVDFYWNDDTEEEVELRKKLFKADFVDKYEKGKSWMSLSY